MEPRIWGLNFSNLTPELVILTVCFRRKEEELSGACVSGGRVFCVFVFFFEGDRVDNSGILFPAGRVLVSFTAIDCLCLFKLFSFDVLSRPVSP